MATTAMLNVRLDRSMKAEGEGVLSRAGLTATDAIRALYQYMEKTHEVPDCCIPQTSSLTADQKRKALRELIGVAPLRSGEDAQTLKAERLSRHSFEATL